MDSGPNIFRTSKKRFGYLRLLAGLMVACCVAMLSDPTCTPAERVASWGGIALFGPCEIILLWMYFDRRPRIIIDSQGIFDRLLGLGRIPWSAIVGARLAFVQDDTVVCLDLQDKQEWISRLPRWHRFLASANRRMGFSEFNLTISNLDATPETIFELILEHLEHSHA